ncbi:MAG: site-specific integrase [Alistipes sp.]|uniref:site-specific integrase n=1 Tax=Alistipes sp. TaxID=1872444 RepID=UPI001B731032|nr:site-specific integrase [Alistipes sp.]MBP3527790.1 site-specific integrase [Alistipes sp.]
MKIKVILRTGKIYKNGQSPLMLRFTHDRNTKLVALGLSVEPHYWNKDAEMLTSDCPERAILQSKIDSALAVYRKKINRLEALDVPVNFDTLFEPTTRKAGITIEDGFNAEIERLESLGKINSATKHKYALQVLDGYKSVKTALEAIDLDYLKGLELYLRQRGNKDNSIATRFAIFKAIYNKAVKEGKVTVKQNPFTLFQVGSLWAKTRKRAIDKDDIQRLIDLEIADGHTTEYRRLARDLFLFSYFTAGMNFGDIARLRYKDIVKGRVNYSRHKTQKLLSFQLVPNALQIIEKYSRANHAQEDYIFPILDRSEHKTAQQIIIRLHKVLRKVNRELKTLGEQIGLKMPLTTYVARHTYATVLKRSGVSVALISESLGHSDLSTTQIYLDSFENSQIDAAMQNLL